MRTLPLSALLPAALCAATTAHSGLAQDIDKVGFGALKRTINVTEPVAALPGSEGDDGIWGVAHVDGLLYVSGSPPLNAAADGGDFGPRIYVVDPLSSIVVGTFRVPEFDFAYDMASDLDGNLIIGGGEGAVVYDRAGNRLGAITGNAGPIPLPLDRRGQPLLHGPSLGPGQALGRYAGVAFDPAGDGGNGSVFVGDTRIIDSIYEVRISSGTTIRKHLNRGWTCAGLAFDPLTGHLWCNSGSPEILMELDPDDDMEPTGNTIEPVPVLPGNIINRFGGLDIIPGGTPGYFWGAAHDLVSISQQSADYLGFHRLHQIPGVPGYSETFLAGSINDDPVSRSTPVLFESQDTLHWGLDHNGRGNYGGPAIHVINLKADASATGFTDTTFLGAPGLLPELVALSVISAPASPTALYVSDALVGDPDVAPPLPTGVISVTLPMKFPVFPGDVIRLQSIYFDPNVPNPLPFAASNEFWFVGRE